MVIGREAVALKYREAWMPPGEEHVDQLLADLLLCQKNLQKFVAKQKHDLERIGAGNREKAAVRQNKPIRHETVKVGVKAGRIIPVGLD